MLLILATIEDDKVRSRLEKLYDKYEQEMYYEAYSVLRHEADAEDAVQNAFFRIWKGLDRLAELGEEEIKWYVLCAAKNAAIDIYRKKKVRLEKEEDYNEDVLYSYLENKDSVDYGLQELIAKLPDRERDVITLKYVYGLQYKEMAILLGISTETVKKILIHAKRKIEKFCKEEGLTND